MPESLSADELRAVIRMQRAILDLFADGDMESWATSCAHEWRAAVGADAAILAVPTRDSVRAAVTDERLVPALAAYEEYYRFHDHGLTEKLPTLDDPSVCHEEQLFSRTELHRDEAYADWRTPNRLFDALLMSGRSPADTPAALIAYRESDRDGYRLNRKKALATLVYPAFDRAVRFWQGHDEIVGRVTNFVERSVGPCILVQGDGRIACTNAAADLVLADPEYAGDLTELVWAIGRGLTTTTGLIEEPCCDVGPYRATALPVGIRALERGGFGGRVTLVLIEDRRESLPSDEVVRKRFGLTERQAQVAILMAKGYTYKRIASEIGVRPNTARRHREAVLRRLKVHSAAEVASLVRAIAAG